MRPTLSKFIENLSPEESRKVLQKVYEAAYKHCGYYPDNGGKKWGILRDYLKDILPKGATVLDVGCGCGLSVRAMLDDGFDGYGIDFAKIDVLWKELGVEGRCSTASADNLPFKDGRFDLVMSMDLMEHIPEAEVSKVLDEIVRVGKKLTAISVCLIDEKVPIIGEVSTHITLKPVEWWRDKFHEAGMAKFTEYTSTDRINMVHWK